MSKRAIHYPKNFNRPSIGVVCKTKTTTNNQLMVF